MARLKVYPFEVLNYTPEQSPRSGRFGTLDAIGKLHGAKAIMAKGVEIDESQLDPDFPGMTRKNFEPQ